MRIYLNWFVKAISIFVFLHIVQTAKLNVPRVLLPVFNNILINYTLEVTDGGCYRWTVSRLDLVMLQPENVDKKQGCSTKAILTAISREKSRNTAIILAEDVITKNVLRCDVILDVIQSLGIVTTTRELFVEEAPEAFEVEAYDIQGNKFTTLEGVEFSWSVIPNPFSSVPYDTHDESDLSTGSVHVTPFMNSPYETPSSVLCFDGQGKYGHIALLEGTNTGSVKVVVRLAQTEYSHITALEVPLLVVANLLMQPPEAYISQGDSVWIQILQVRKGRVHKVDISHGQYYLQAEDNSIVNLDGSLVSGLKFGATSVFVRDHNSRLVAETPGVDIPKLPQGKVTVTAPAKLRLSLNPYDNWVTIVGKKYAITAELYTSDDQKMHIGEGVRIKISLDENLFNVAERSLNGSFIEGVPVKRGSSRVYAELLHVFSSDGTTYKPAKLTATAEMLIFDNIMLSPSEVILPWDPTTLARFKVQLQASGGDGDFIWSSEDPSIVAVAQNGLITTLGLGFTNIKAAMSRNVQNYETAGVYVISPVALEIIDYILEVPVGSELNLHVALFGIKHFDESDDLLLDDKLPFSECHTLPLRVQFDENNFVVGGSGKPSPSTVGISCASLVINATSPGSCRVTVSYDLINGETLQDTIIVSAFRPLEVLEPQSAVTVLALGSSRNVIFSGGPKPWLGRPTEHVYSLKTKQEDSLSITELTEFTSSGRSGIYVYNILCREVGKHIVTFTVGNIPTLPNCHHKLSEIPVIVICALPRSLHLSPVITSPDPDSCPMDINAETIVQHNYKDVLLGIEIHDSIGRKFDNITSLKIDWVLEPCQLSLCGQMPDFTMDIRFVHGVPVPDKTLQIISTRNKSGVLKISADVRTYKMMVLKDLNVIPEWPEFGVENEKGVLETPQIRDTVNLYLARDTEVNPENITLFNHPDNVGKIYIGQGSGYYELRLTSDNVANVNYDDKNRELTIQPRDKGSFRIDLVDLCLSSQTPSVYVNIVSVQKILVNMPDRVEKGRCIKAIVKLLDEFGELMPVPDEKLLDLRYTSESNIISIKLAPKDPSEIWGLGEVHFIVTGMDIGDTKLSFRTGHENREIVSDSLNVQVFAPLLLSPRNMTLIVGSSLQILPKGGPSVDISVEFLSEKDRIAEVKSGIVTGLSIGHSKIIGRAVGLNPGTGALVTYSQDVVDVYVIPLSGINIQTPLVQVEVGAVLPFWITGSPDTITPMILGTRNPPLEVLWESIGPDTGIANIKSVFHNTGIDYEGSDQIRVCVVAVRPGRVQIKASVNIPSSVGVWRTDNVLTSVVELEIFAPLSLISPVITSNHILIAPNSKVNLLINKQTRSSVSYSVQSWIPITPNSSLVSELTISKSGVLHVKSAPGIGLIVISTKDDNGIQQSLGVTIECKPVHYMMLDILSPIKLSQRSSKLPRGLSASMQLSYYDNLGRKMIANSAEINVKTSRTDLANIVVGRDNSTLQLDLQLAGDTMLKVYKRNAARHLVDYIKLSVSDIGSPIANYSSFTVGDVVCFSTQLSMDNGLWTSSDSTVVSIDGKTGVARMLKETITSVIVMFNLNDITVYKVDVTIMPVQKIELMTKEDVCFTGEQLHIYFQLGQEIQSTTSSNMFCEKDMARRLQPQVAPNPNLFSCNLMSDDLKTMNLLENIYIVPSFNFTNGLYSCSLSMSQPITKTHADSYISLSIRSGSIMSKMKNIRLLPPVHVTPTELAFHETGKTFLTITGHDSALADIKVEPSDSKILSVDKHSMTPGQLRYRIRVKNFEYANIVIPYIFVSVPVTKQYFTIPINMRDTSDFCYVGSGSPILSLLYYYRYTLTFLVTVLAVIFSSVYLHASKVQKRTCLSQPGVTCDPSCPSHLDKITPGLFNKSGTRLSYGGENLQLHNMLQERSGVGGPSSPGTSPRSNANTSVNDSGAVYGDSTYYTTPDTRRNRRFI